MERESEQIPKDAAIFVAGHGGLVGSAIMRRLRALGYHEHPHRNARPARSARPGGGELLVPRESPGIRVPRGRDGRRHPCELDSPRRVHLRQHDDPRDRRARKPPLRRAQAPVPRQLLHLPTQCAEQPITEEALLTGPLEPTNEPYAIAKIAGIKLCQAYRHQYGCNFISGMPTNLYGPNDNFDLESSHVLPALIRKFHDAKLSGDSGRRGVGFRTSPTRVPPCRRSRRRLSVPDGELQRRRTHQHWHRRRPHHRRSRRHRSERGVPRRADRLRHVEAGRHAAKAPRRRPPRARSAGRRALRCRTGSRSSYNWFLEHQHTREAFPPRSSELRRP